MTEAVVQRIESRAVSQRIPIAILVAAVIAAPWVVYPFFAMKVLCFSLFACAFNLLIGYVGLLSFGHALFFGGASYASAETQARVEAHLDGTVTTAGSLTVTAEVTSGADALSIAVSGGIIGALNAAVSTARITKPSGAPSARASLGTRPITVTGDITISSSMTGTAIATAEGTALAAGIAAGGSITSGCRARSKIPSAISRFCARRAAGSSPRTTFR